MNAKKLSFLLLILVAVACTNRSTSSEQDEMRHWNNVLQQNQCLTTRKQSATNVGSCQTDLARNPGIGRKKRNYRYPDLLCPQDILMPAGTIT